MMEATLQAMGDFFRQQVHGIRRFGAARWTCARWLRASSARFSVPVIPVGLCRRRLILEEAGGRVTNCQGISLPLATMSLLASNGYLHEQALRIVSARQPSPSPLPSTEEV